MKTSLHLIPLVASLISVPAWSEEAPTDAPADSSAPAAPAHVEQQRTYLDAVRAQREALMAQRRSAAEQMHPVAPIWGEAERHARDAAIEQRRDDIERFHEARRNAMQGWQGGPWHPGFGPMMPERAQMEEMREERIQSIEQGRGERLNAMERMREERMQWGPGNYPAPYGPTPYGPMYPHY